MDELSAIKIIGETVGASVETVMGRERSLTLWNARYMAWTYLHCEMGMSVGKISRMFGRNAPSVFRGIRVLRHNMRYDHSLREAYHAAVEKIKGAAEAVPEKNETEEMS